MENNFRESIWINSNICENCVMSVITNVHKIYGLESAYKIWKEANNTILSYN